MFFSIGSGHFGFVLSKLVLFSQYRAKRLAGKNVAKTTCFVFEWDAKH